MSCEACTEFQRSEYTSWFRWKNADIEIRCCDEHRAELYAALRSLQSAWPAMVDRTAPAPDWPDLSPGVIAPRPRKPWSTPTLRKLAGAELEAARRLFEGRRR